jgi:aminomethyltransferase
MHELAGATFTVHGGCEVPEHFGRPAEEYRDVRSAAGLFDRSWRGLIELNGRDRAAWLDNLLTSAIKTLQPGVGNYAFALNAKGRVLFDCDVLVGRESIRLDLDRSVVQRALQHLDHYLVTEDVSLADRSAEFAHLSLLGPNAARILEPLGVGNAVAMAQLQHGTLELAGKPRRFARHDNLAGVFGVEMWVESEDAQASWKELLQIGSVFGLRPVGLAAVQAVRIEAGIPWFGKDIDEQVIPLETLQIERGISFIKGCYVGHEVIERMRSRGVVARRLIGAILEGERLPGLPATIRIDGADAGRLTSACRSPANGQVIGLGYVKAGQAEAGTAIIVCWADGELAGELTAVPTR